MGATEKYDPEWWEALLLFASKLGGWALRALVGMLAWRWFVVPLGAPVLGFWWMVAATWVSTGVLPFPAFELSEPRTEKKYYEQIVAHVLTPLLVLAVLAVLRGVVK